MVDEPRRYVFSPLERRGVLLGLGAGQLATVAGGLLAGVVAARVAGGAAGAGLGVLVALSFFLAAVWPVSGRPVAGWVPVLARFATRRMAGPQLHGPPAGGGLVRGVKVLDVPGPPVLGVVRDRRAGTWAAVVPVRGRSFALLDRAEQERRLGAWGAILAGLARARSPVRRLQWVERGSTGDCAGLVRHLDAAPGGALACARQSYEALLSGAATGSQDHQVYLVLTVAPRRGADPVDVLCRELRFLQGRLRDAGLGVATPLSAAELGAVLADCVQGAAVRRSGWPWAMATDEAWSCLRADGCWHATYWVAEWPRVDVPADFLAPLLLVRGVRSVAVTLGPVPPERATRQVESARTADLADDELRRRAGFLDTARRRRQADGVARREAELANGHAEYRFSGYVTVTGADRESLEADCAEVEQAAQTAHLHLRRLYGQQAEAFTWTLPLGRGLA